MTLAAPDSVEVRSCREAGWKSETCMPARAVAEAGRLDAGTDCQSCGDQSAARIERKNGLRG